MIDKTVMLIPALIVLYSCASAPVKAPAFKTESKQDLRGCSKYLSADTDFRGGCAEGDCNNGFEIFVYENGDCYEGTNENNVRHGHGIMHYRVWGEKYTGDWVHDNRVGRGTLNFVNGDVYEGEFKLNVPWGTGVYRYADGSVEQGEFFDYLFVNAIRLPGLTDRDKVEAGRVSGVNQSAGDIIVEGGSFKSGDKLFIEISGRMAALEVVDTSEKGGRCRMIGGTRILSGHVTAGMPVFIYMQGIKRGDNTFLFPNGNRYIGEYNGSNMHGEGEFYWSNGNIYKGGYNNGMRHGKGVLTYYNGSIYSGVWRNGYMDGEGEYRWTNGDRYTGSFSKGFREGYATFIWGNGDKYVGSFKKDLMDGQGEYNSVNGDSYTGQYKDNMRDGIGTYTSGTGEKYSGQWKKNLQDGSGTFVRSDGGRYVGEWKDHKMHGRGTEYDPSGRIIRQGVWDNGNFIGEGI